MKWPAWKAAEPWLIAIGGTAAVTALGRSLNLNPNTVGFAFLIVVLFSSLRGGLLGGTAASIAATLCYNFFFFPPLYTLTIHEASNWVALAAFLATSVIVSRLVVVKSMHAERAERRRHELEMLYAERERFLEERAHLQALEESERLKTSLLQAISHDLTTPLTALTLHTEAVRRKAESDADLAEPLAGIAGETARLRRRIDNLLAMARLEAGKTKPRREPAPPADLFRAARENLPLVFASRAVTIRVAEDCPDANVDPTLVLEILVNLIENAHRVSPRDTTIELTARASPDDAGQVRLEVLDRGPGVPATSDAAQRGLGLEIARGLAEVNGGSVELLHRPGGGTIARVHLPAAPLPTEAG